MGVEHQGAEVEGGGRHGAGRAGADGGVLPQGQLQAPTVAAAGGCLRRRHRQLPLLLCKRLYRVCFLLQKDKQNTIL